MFYPYCKNPGSAGTLHRIKIEHPLSHVSLCIVAFNIAAINIDISAEIVADPRKVMEVKQHSLSSHIVLDYLVGVGAVEKSDADGLKWVAAEYAQEVETLDGFVDPIFSIARRIAAAAVADLVRQGVPGLLTLCLAVAETLRPHAYDSEILRNG